LSAEQATQVLHDTVRRCPRLSGVERSRWTLATLRAALGWLKPLSLSGIHRLLHRLGVRYRRGQERFHSPDPDYDTKMAAVAGARAEAAARPGPVVMVYQDEFTYYRRPSVAQNWTPKGGPGRPARLGHKSNSQRRTIGTLDARTGRLFCWQRAHADVATLIRYYRALEAAYPEAEVIYVAQDNWPVHFHADVVAALATSKVRLLRLPTYAPWTNPIEKVWRRLKQELLHQHEYADDWSGLQAAVTAWLDKWAHGSDDLLRYVGLCPG
jgi:transposase